MAAEQHWDGNIRIAMLGMVEGNGHPYSWSAIINGYDSNRIEHCPYPVIAEYLERQPSDAVGIEGAEVTHIWAEDSDAAKEISQTTYINKVVDEPEDVIGEVDAIVIPTDDGDGHVQRVSSFIDTGLPIFVDKPLATNLDDLSQFVEWHQDGIPISSSSAMRYAPAVNQLSNELSDIGNTHWVTNATHKTWKRYGIHALEPISKLFGPGFRTVDARDQGHTTVFDIEHRNGCTLTIGVNYDMRGGFGRISIYGSDSNRSSAITDTYTTFRNQLLSVIEFFRTLEPSVSFRETVDLMAAVIAGRRSQNQNRPIQVSELYDSLSLPQLER